MPGAFRRAIHIVPGTATTSVEVEDDMHHMRVVLRHDAQTIRAVEPQMFRHPWSTCPGAEAQLVSSFTGARLAEAARVGAKTRNCTHLFDLAVLAAAHAGEPCPLLYDITVTDPVGGVRHLTIERDGVSAMTWREEGRRFVAPEAIAGRSVLEMGDWIAALPPSEAEMARLLRGAAIISHGRTIPMEQQSDATRVPANCHTFQPGQREHARRISGLHDFTEAMNPPLSWIRNR